MKAALVAALVLSAVVVTALVSYVVLIRRGASSDGGPDGSKTVTMNCTEFEAQTTRTIASRKTIVEFESLAPGDTLVLEDEVTYVAYDATMNETTLVLEGCWGGSIWGISIPGDRIGPYGTGDIIMANMTVMTFNVSVGETEWSGEWMREAWNEERDWPGYYATLDPSAVTVVSSGECQEGVNLIEGVDSDGTHWMLQITSTPSGKLLAATNLTVWSPLGGESLPGTPLATFGAGEVNGIRLVQGDPNDRYLAAGDIILLDQVLYPGGSTFDLSDHCGTLYSGEL